MSEDNLVAAIQMVSGMERDANLEQAAALIKEAAERGAKMVLLPENFALMHPDERQKTKIAEHDCAGPMQDFLGSMAAIHQVYLMGGTIPLKADQPGKVRAASLFYNPQGERIARYDKIHLFDVNLESGEVRGAEKYRESNSIEPGDQVVVIETEIGKVGMAVCYDLRFPGLFAQMVDQGAEIIALPSAFTWTTGRDHWEVLLRARAIECQCYLIAPNQGGEHANGRKTWGHSMIIDPWGKVLSVCDVPGSGMAVGQIDLSYLKEVRKNLPVLEHRRLGS